MDINRIPAPLLVIPAIVCVLYGFGIFETFSVERSIDTPAVLGLKTAVPSVIATRSAVTPAASNTTASVNLAPIETSQSTSTISAKPTPTLSDIDYKVVAHENIIAQHSPLTVNSNQLATEEEEALVSITNEAQADDQEPLIAAPPSMATQATPVEMSDGGEVELTAPETDG